MELLILGGYLVFFAFGVFFGKATAAKQYSETSPSNYATYEQEQLDRQWHALFSYDPINPKEEFDE